MKTSYVLFAGVVGSTAVASANAFNINEHDAKVTGRGDATAASNIDPSSIVYNPGGMAVSPGTSFSLGSSLYIASGSYTLDGTTDTVSTDSDPALVPSFYLTSRIGKTIAFGVGVHFPFGLALSWPTDHAQADVAQDQSLTTTFITPAVGFNLDKLIPGLSIGGGVDIVPASVELSRAVLFGDTRGSAHLAGDTVGVGARAGLMYRSPQAQKFKFGVMWRSAVELDLKGNGDFDIVDPYRAQLPPDGEISTTITLPQSIVVGAGVDVTPDFEVELNAVWIDWSKFKELRIALPGGTETVTPEDYRDTLSLRVGCEYALRAAKAALRAGFIYDPTPIPRETLSAQLPDVDRKDVSIGGSKYFGNFGAHLGLLWVLPDERDTSSTLYMPTYKGRYGVEAFVASLSLSGAFGK